MKFFTSFSLLLLLLASLISVPSFATTPVVTPTNSPTPTKQVICGGSCPLIDSTFSLTKENITAFIIAFARFLTYIAVALSVLMIVFAGVQFIVGQREAGRKRLVSALIGLVVVIVAYTIIAFIVGFLQGDVLGSINSTPGSTSL